MSRDGEKGSECFCSVFLTVCLLVCLIVLNFFFVLCLSF